MIRIYHHTSQLRANSERAPLNSLSVSGHRLLCASLLVFSYLSLGRCCCCRCRVSRFVFSSAQTPLSGAAPLFFSAAALLSLCVEAAVVCVTGGRRHGFRRQDRHPAPLLWLSGHSGFLLFLLLIGISKAVVLLGLRLRSPPVASGRLRSPPVASGRLRSPPVDLSLAKHKRDGPRVGSGGAWVGFGGSWGHCFSARTRLGD